MTVIEWLQSPLYRDRPHPTALERVAELVGLNGGSFEVHGWGITSGGGLYGRTGLDQEEAHELILLDGIMRGFSLAEGSTRDADALRLLQEEWRRVRQARLAQEQGAPG